VRERIDHVAPVSLDLFEPRLRPLLGSFVVVAERPRHRPPKQVGGGSDKSRRGEFVGDLADVRIDAMDGAGQHYRPRSRGS
jgi:hypothetical protein